MCECGDWSALVCGRADTSRFSQWEPQCTIAPPGTQRAPTMESQKNYKSFWNDKAATPDSAFIAVDGSTNEETARLTGTYSGHQVSAALDIQPTDRVLELGCGVGRIGREIAPRVAHWEGTDISANMIEVARERLKDHSNVGFTELSRSSLQPLPDASFDKAYCVAVFIHMDKEDFFLYLEELARVLKPGGLVYFDVWNMASEVGWRRYAIEIDQHRAADHARRKDVARNQFSCPEEVRIFLDRTGFDQILELAESPWVQAIGVRRGADCDLALMRQRAQTVSARVAYSPLWTELFAGILDVATGKTPPMELWDSLANDDRGEEIPMFREWYLGMWKGSEATWGPAPR
jgi:ubiquinone/menaquinone biosynthesis C-methylase UbiE